MDLNCTTAYWEKTSNNEAQIHLYGELHGSRTYMEAEPTEWIKYQPKGYSGYAKNENKLLAITEKIGQIAVTCLAVIFTDANICIIITDIGEIIPYRNLYILLGFALMAAAVVLGIGHIGIHAQHYKAVKKSNSEEE